jgi:membrane-bound lytic murein transglycosylase D
MRLLALLSLILILTSKTFAQVTVPDEIEFGGMRLRLTEGLKRLLKSDIELITKSPKGFQIKVDRANLYFPLIERVLKEEGLPLDFKFLALQESSLVPDAISTSKAVGYWQFKKESAVEVGLRVDHEVDERMNIISSTRGAGKYLKKNNVTLNNWVYALLSYNTGLGGVKSLVKEKYLGASEMTIDQDMHWYVIRFLAHKLAYQNAVGKLFNPSLILAEYAEGNNKTLRDIASETQLDIVNIESYNKWLLKHSIPNDKPYSVILPVTPQQLAILKEKNMIHDSNSAGVLVAESHVVPVAKEKKRVRDNNVKASEKPKKRRTNFSGEIDQATIALLTEVNRIRAIKAKEGDTPDKLSIQGGISVEDFLRYNDLKSFESIVPGKIYFLQPKRKKAVIAFHTVKSGESLRDISQEFGISVHSIRTKNRMKKGERLEEGRILWLRKKRPKGSAIEFKKVTVANSVQENTVKPVSTEKHVEPNKVDSLPTAGTLISSDKDIDHNNENSYSVSKIYKVKQGETLYSISRNVGVPVDSIKVWNGLYDNVLKPGMDLQIYHSDKQIHTTPSIPNNHVDPIKQGNTKGAKTGNSMVHVVQQGETMYSICRNYSIEVDSILSWNNLKDYSLKQGMTLIIKKGESSQPKKEDVEHIVQTGETLYKISKQYNVTVDDILKWNNKTTATVSIGEKLVIKKGR